MRSVEVSPANLGVLILCVPWDSSHLGLFQRAGSSSLCEYRYSALHGFR